MTQGVPPAATRVIVVSDVVGSTTWRVDHGDAAADRFQRRFSEIVADATRSVGGRLIEDRGDGFLCSFDSAISAIAAAVSVREQLSGVDVGSAPNPAIRIGIAAGDVVERGREMYGLPVVTAARLEQSAESGEIVCTELVRALAGTRTSATFVNPRALELDGLLDPVDLWTVAAVVPEESDRPTREPLTTTGDLPAWGTKFFGRERELAQLEATLSERALVTILGPGGVGKTRLATELAASVASQYGDGAWFVPLESASDVDGVIVAIMRALRLPGATGPDGLDALARTLGPSETLIVLDNCEQAVEAIAPVAEALLASAPDLRLVATSREPLGLRAEARWQLDSLEPPRRGLTSTELRENPSFELLVDRIRLTDAGAELGPDELQALAEIVRRLDGFPLAIELAAGRFNVLPPAEMAARTDTLIQLLAGNERDRPDRHRTIGAALDWSVSTLSQLERYVLVGVAVFAGGAPLDAVGAVCPGIEDELVDLLGGLVEKSLIRSDDSGRFTMLSPIRETILHRDDLSSGCQEATRRHLDYYSDLARRLGSLLQSQPAHLSRFVEEDQNLGLALDAARAESKSRALGLAGDLGLYWVLSGRASEGDRRFSEILATPGDVEPSLLATAMRSAAMAAGLGARYARSEQLLLAARALYSELDRVDSIAYCDVWLARNSVVQCHFGLLEPAALDLAYDRLDRSVKTFEGVGDPMGVLLAYPYLGWARLLQGDRSGAARLTDELVGRAKNGPDDLVSVYAVAHCGFMRSMLGELDVAAVELDQAMEALAGSGDAQNLLITACVDVAVRDRLGDHARARTSALAMVDCAERCQSSEWESLAMTVAAHVVASAGDWTTAAEIIASIEERFPTWRVALRNTGIEPGAVLEHAFASSPFTAGPLTRTEALRSLRRSLERITHH